MGNWILRLRYFLIGKTASLFWNKLHIGINQTVGIRVRLTNLQSDQSPKHDTSLTHTKHRPSDLELWSGPSLVCPDVPRDSFRKGSWSSYMKFCTNWLCSNFFILVNHCCTRHNNWTVVVWAKLCPVLLIVSHLGMIYISARFWWLAHDLFLMVSRSCPSVNSIMASLVAFNSSPTSAA